MNPIDRTLCVVMLAGAAFAQQPDAAQTIARLSTTAQQHLATSSRALTDLREQISGEKLPLSSELTKLEDTLTQLRREHDRVTRLVDEGNLEIPTIKGEIKVHQDELAYIGNLLDEYARNLETKLNVCELQYCGKPLESAKQAKENSALSLSEKLERQLEVANVSTKRLLDVIGGMRFAGTGVDADGVVVDGQYAIIGPVALFAAKGAGATGLVVPQSGSTKPLIRALDGAMQKGIAAVVQDGDGRIPLDPSLGGALKALVQRTNIFHIFEKGGPIMWPLLIASILALGTALERLLFLSREKLRRDPQALERFFAAVSARDTQGAIAISEQTRFFLVRALGRALAHKETSLSSALLYAQAQELKRFQRGIPILDTVITLAPLLGLLGTVTGMMGSFSLIGGELSSPGAITGGIAEALIATAFGLGIAITALIPFNFLNSRLEDARHEIESAATQLELLMHPPAPLPAAIAVAEEPEHADAVGAEKA